VFIFKFLILIFILKYANPNPDFDSRHLGIGINNLLRQAVLAFGTTNKIYLFWK